MNEAGFPVVLLDRDVRGSSLDGVFMDNFNSAYQSVSEFIKNGHTHIAIIAGPLTSTSGMARLKGYTSALKDNGLPVRGEYILLGDFKFDLAYSLTKEMLSKYPRVTAIFASNSRMSSGCLAALRERNIKIPEDMAFISCGRPDGSFEKISVVLYPAQAIGEGFASLLLEKIQGGKKLHGPGKQVTFDMQLKLCGSEVYPINRKRKKRS